MRRMAALSPGQFSELLEPMLRQLMDNASLTSVPLGKLYEPDEMQALFDLSDENRDG